MALAYKQIYNQQLAWARQKGIKLDKDGYTLNPNENLFHPLSPQTKAEFASGKGDELGSEGIRGKIQALHSSSALVVNLFDYWRNRDVSTIATALDAPNDMTEIHFERTYSTSLGGIPPHLDVELSGKGLPVLAIESKFTEPYHYHTKRRIKNKYLTRGGPWSELPNCKKLVKRIKEEEQGRTSFAYLDAPQLLKHILGLTTKFGVSNFELLYLWYEIPSTEANKHKQEIDEFKRCIGNDILFRDITYQELFRNITKCPNAEESYLSYLAERYLFV